MHEAPREIEPIADSAADAGRRLGICRSLVFKEIAAGRLKARKIGRRTLIERTEQERYLRSLPYREADGAIR